MTTRREYAISLGLASPGRGRMSREANAAIAKAEAEGTVFDVPRLPTSEERKSARHAVKERAEEARKVIRETSPVPKPTSRPKLVEEMPVRPSKPFTGKFEVQIPDGKRKTLSDRTACTCGASLSYCHCATPTVYRTIVDPMSDDVDMVLNIERV